MKKLTFLLSIFIVLFSSQNSNAQCTTSNYVNEDCSEFITVNNNNNLSNNDINSTRGTAATKYYITSNAGEPWGNSGGNNTATFNLAFPTASSWAPDYFETLNVSSVFDMYVSFIFLDGSDGNATALNTFLTTNITAIENWVDNGGKLLINAAPNTGGNINFGFNNTVLNYDGSNTTASVTVVDTSHPAFVGPLSPTSSIMTANDYGHATITGTGYTNILVDTNDSSRVILAEKQWGSGLVMVGGMTTANFHLPTTESLNWRANLYTYMDNYTFVNDDKYYIRSNLGEPWAGSNADNSLIMDAAFGSGNWFLDFFESLNPSTVFASTTSIVYIDGSDNGNTALESFLTANISVIENWVNNGGSLLLNSAPNSGGNINFGFNSTTLNYADPTDNVTVVDTSHPAFVGPLTPTSATMNGSNYAHATITGVNYTNLLVDSSNSARVVLAEKAWGSGIVMVGGMTAAVFHTPTTESFNWRANLLTYLHNASANLGNAESNLLKQELLVYPNPVEDELNISYTGNLEINKITVYSITGAKIIERNYEDSIDVSNLESGVYYVKFESDNVKTTKKIIKK